MARQPGTSSRSENWADSSIELEATQQDVAADCRNAVEAVRLSLSSSAGRIRQGGSCTRENQPQKKELPGCASIRTIEESREVTPCFRVVYMNWSDWRGHNECTRKWVTAG